MSPTLRRGLALALLLALLAPAAVGQVPPRPPPPEPPSPEEPTPPDVQPYPPDLYPTSLSVTARDARSPTQVCVSVQDIAQPPSQLQTEQPIGQFWVKVVVYLQRQGDTPTLWAENQTLHQGTMRAQSTAVVCLTFALSSGTYLANVLVDSEHDVAEANETNNARPRDTTFKVAPSPLPDLRVSRLVVSPDPAGDGRQVGIVATVLNDGDAPSVATSVLVADESGFARSLRLVPLAAHQSTQVSTAFLANDHAAGLFHATATVDPDDLVVEYPNDNNVVNVTFTILPHPAPDLTITGASVNGTMLAHRGLRVDANVQNAGNRTANATKLRLFVDGVVNSNASIPSLSANATAKAEFFLLLAAGEHALRLVVDPDLNVAELDESNNDYALHASIREPAANETQPNLVVQRLSAGPDDPAPNETVTVDAIVGNLGAGASNATSVEFDVGGIVLGRAKVAPVAPGRSLSVRFSWPVHTPGPYALRATVDPDGNVSETDDEDNALTLFLTILPPAAPTEATPEEPVTLPPGPKNDTSPPTPPTTPPAAAAATVDVTKVLISTHQVAGGLRGIVSAALRNPSFDPLGRVLVSFKVDGKSVKEQLVESIPAAGLGSATTGEIELPGGNHTVTVEARIAGSSEPASTLKQSYDALPGPKNVDAPPVALALGAALAAALLALRRRR